MWTVVYIAPTKTVAEKITSALTEEGLLVSARAVGLPHGGDGGSYEILVAESELDEAMEIINSINTRR
ncbi:MAG TPA: glutamate decarboxylase [Bacillota bacterium]|nr:glutamate decarboxylase [Bacillota bacterium]